MSEDFRGQFKLIPMQSKEGSFIGWQRTCDNFGIAGVHGRRQSRTIRLSICSSFTSLSYTCYERLVLTYWATNARLPPITEKKTDSIFFIKKKFTELQIYRRDSKIPSYIFALDSKITVIQTIGSTKKEKLYACTQPQSALLGLHQTTLVKTVCLSTNIINRQDDTI